MNSFDRLAVKQLDDKSLDYRALVHSQQQEGWIRMLRSVLRMPASYLSKKIGISQPSLVGLEKSEKERTITLASLDKVAKALNCKVVYGFFPLNSYEKFIKDEELRVAREYVENVQKTMSLEEQVLRDLQQKEQEEIILEDIKSKPLKKLWKYDVV